MWRKEINAELIVVDGNGKAQKVTHMSVVTCQVGKNRIIQESQVVGGNISDPSAIVASWENSVAYKAGNDELSSGLRSAQLGALFSIKAHWTVSDETATVVMPTGTGKTETMIAIVVSENIKHTLIIVPSKLLRAQTSEKFRTFGVLKEIGVISEAAIYPAIAVLTSSPANISELKEIIDKSNVIVATMSLLKNFPDSFLTVINKNCDALIVDEAHHIAAKQWSRVRARISDLRCLQFTATPFRNDTKKIDGQIVYNFPLSLAQKQGYFQKINFLPIHEFDEEKGNAAIAAAAITQLEHDLSNDFHHIVLVRAKDKRSATKLYDEIYKKFYNKYNPVLIHSGNTAKENAKSINALKNGVSKIVVCVDMFGEGIDIPNLKIAAIHDKYKSLPITLQFVGRFARSNRNIGIATLITNIANDDLSESLDELYSQDSDWNVLLHRKSFDKIDKELSLQELANGFDKTSFKNIAIQQLRPKISLVAYDVKEKSWNVKGLNNLFDQDRFIVTVNSERNVIAIVEKKDSYVEWSSFKGVCDVVWHLHLIYWNKSKNILYINSTQKSFSDALAKSLFARPVRVKGERVFRCLHGINRLMLASVGLKAAHDGPVRYRMFAGIDVGDGIAESQKTTSSKSNLFGTGYDGTGAVSIGCSYKGTIWSRWVESVDYWMRWCDDVAGRIQDNSIDTKKILEGSLVPEIIYNRPNKIPYSIELPLDLDIITDRNIVIMHGDMQIHLHTIELRLVNPSEFGAIKFSIGIDGSEVLESYELDINKDGFKIIAIRDVGLTIKFRNKELPLIEFFSTHPPRIRFVDQSTLEHGNLLVKINDAKLAVFEDHRLIKWTWEGVNLRKESQGVARDRQSIQYHVIKYLRDQQEYEVIFDDDGAGEVADIVCIGENDNFITIHFYHCKYSHGDNPGARVSDLYEVCGQAEKSIKWFQCPQGIIDRLIMRESTRYQNEEGTRIEVGSLKKLREIKKKMRIFKVQFGVTIVQPGISYNKLTDEMRHILSGTSAYLLDTFGLNLRVICS